MGGFQASFSLLTKERSQSDIYEYVTHIITNSKYKMQLIKMPIIQTLITQNIFANLNFDLACEQAP